MPTFRGSLEDLKDRLLLLGLDGEWLEQPNGVWKFRCSDRSALLWSSTKGTVWFEGPPGSKAAFERRVTGQLENGRPRPLR